MDTELTMLYACELHWNLPKEIQLHTINPIFIEIKTIKEIEHAINTSFS